VSSKLVMVFGSVVRFAATLWEHSSTNWENISTNWEA